MSIIENDDLFGGVAEYLDESGLDLNEAKAGGASIAAEGKARARLVGYIELGTKYDEKYKKQAGRAVLLIELSGKNWPVGEFEGEKRPVLLREYINLPADFGQLSKKSGAYKLFSKLNWRKKARHFGELVQQQADFLVDVKHEPSKDGSRKFASIRDDDGYRISPTTYTDAQTEEEVSIKVDPAVSKPRLFLWNTPRKAQWDSIYIAGEFEAREEERDASGKVIRQAQEARSANVYQEQILGSLGFDGSPIQALLGPKLESLGTVEQVEGGAADPLAS